MTLSMRWWAGYWIMQASSTGCSRAGVRQAVEKRSSAALRSLFVFAAYQKYASFLTISRALHLRGFEQPEQRDFFNALLDGYYLSDF